MEDHRTANWVRIYRIVFALATLFAIAYQFNHLRENGGFRPANFFSFFTIESNLFASAIFLLGALTSLRFSQSRTWDMVRGAAALYMITTGVVYGLLLSGYQEELQTTIPWVDTVLHKLFPLVLFADWLICPPVNRIPFKRALIWLTYPLVYCAYSLIRGPIVDWYPYPFLNPDSAGGYIGVVGYCMGIAIGVTLFTAGLVWIGNRVRLRTIAPDSALNTL